MVRKMTPVKSLDVLRMTPKMAAQDMVKALETVLANAKQKGLETDSLAFKTIEINESMKMRRFRPGTRGRVRPFKRRMSHIKIVLSDELGVMSKNIKDKKLNIKNKEKAEKKEEEKK